MQLFSLDTSMRLTDLVFLISTPFSLIYRTEGIDYLINYDVVDSKMDGHDYV